MNVNPLSHEIVHFGMLEGRLYECDNRLAAYRDQDFVAPVREVFDRELRGKQTVFSLDVFDTLLLRDNSSELERFFEFGGAMSALHTKVSKAQKFKPIDGFVARNMGTKASYRASARLMGAREGSLNEIHLTASRLLRLGDDWAQQFVECEIECESKRITPNPFLLDYIKEVKARGNPVILLSDMYFHADHIRSLLNLLDVDDKLFDLVCSSGDEKISKASGLIFRKVARDLKADSFFHIGDSFKSDFANPARAGWSAMHLPLARADIAARRESHDRVARILKDDYSIKTDVQRP